MTKLNLTKNSMQTADKKMNIWKPYPSSAHHDPILLLLPGMAAGERGPERDAVALAGEPTGEGDGPRMPGR